MVYSRSKQNISKQMEQSEYRSKDLAVKIEDDDESKANKSFFLGNQNADGNIS